MTRVESARSAAVIAVNRATFNAMVARLRKDIFPVVLTGGCCGGRSRDLNADLYLSALAVEHPPNEPSLCHYRGVSSGWPQEVSEFC